MASFLSINNYEVSVRHDNADLTRSAHGSEKPALDGTILKHTRAMKRRWGFKTGPLSETDGMALAKLIQGHDGHAWSFDHATDYYYSSKGLPKESGTITRTVGGWDGAYASMAAGAEVIWDPGFTDYTKTTLMVRRKNGGTWYHHILLGDGTKYLDGVVDAGAIAFMSVTSNGKVHLGDTGSVATQLFDDFVALPFLISATMAAAFGTATAPFSSLPDLTCTGDFVQGTSVTCVGVGPVRARLFQATFDGAWAQNVYELGFELQESA